MDIITIFLIIRNIEFQSFLQSSCTYIPVIINCQIFVKFIMYVIFVFCPFKIPNRISYIIIKKIITILGIKIRCSEFIFLVEITIVP